MPPKLTPKSRSVSDAAQKERKASRRRETAAENAEADGKPAPTLRRASAGDGDRRRRAVVGDDAQLGRPPKRQCLSGEPEADRILRLKNFRQLHQTLFNQMLPEADSNLPGFSSSPTSHLMSPGSPDCWKHLGSPTSPTADCRDWTTPTSPTAETLYTPTSPTCGSPTAEDIFEREFWRSSEEQ